MICLLSQDWEASRECETQYRYAETLNKAILVGRLEPLESQRSLRSPG
jgi:hypothetical protein